jgi:hypothetical protein
MFKCSESRCSEMLLHLALQVLTVTIPKKEGGARAPGKLVPIS